MKPLHRFTYRLLKLFARWLSLLPDRSRDRLAQRLAGFVYHGVPLRRDLALNNLRRAFPQHDPAWHSTVLRRSYLFFIRMMLLFFTISVKYRQLKIHVSGRHHLDDARRQDKGVILVSGHFGAWEVFAAWTGNNHYPVVPVAVRQKNRGADRFFTELRQSYGILPIYRRSSLDNMYRTLEQGKILTLGSDQDARRHGVIVDFFGIPASTPKGTALFHLNTGAPIVFGACHRSGDEYFLRFAPIPVAPGDGVPEITRKYTALLEQCIRRHPEQYFWWHRRWKTKPKHS